MADQDQRTIGRRQFLRIAGGSVVAGSLGGLTACGAGDTSAPKATAEPAPAPKPAAPKQAPTAAAPAPETAPAQTTAPAGAAEAVSESDPVAMSLGYKENAADVDLTKFPRRGEAAAANQYCRNCALYSGADGAASGPCAIFQGKLVSADGWCSAYSPAS